MDLQIYQKFIDLEQDHWWFRGRRSVYMGLLNTHLNNKIQGKVLDLGCGLGGFLPSLKSLGFDVYGAEMDFDSVLYCIKRGFPQCAQTDSSALPFADDSFDLVTMFDAIEHIEDDHQTMAEVARVLKPGGKVIISVPAYQFLYTNNDRVAQHFRRYNRKSTRMLFEKACLDVERNTHANVLLFPIILVVVMMTKIVEFVFDANKESSHNNLSWPMPSFVNNILYRIFTAELIVTRHADWPIGHSIVAIAINNQPMKGKRPANHNLDKRRLY